MYIPSRKNHQRCYVPPPTYSFTVILCSLKMLSLNGWFVIIQAFSFYIKHCFIHIYISYCYIFTFKRIFKTEIYIIDLSHSLFFVFIAEIGVPYNRRHLKVAASHLSPRFNVSYIRMDCTTCGILELVRDKGCTDSALRMCRVLFPYIQHWTLG